MEDVIDVFDQRDTRHVHLHFGPSLREVVVAHLGEVIHVNRHVQVFGEGAGECRFAGTGRAVKHPATLPRDALFDVPAFALPPQFDLLDEILHPLREDQVIERLAVVRAGFAELLDRVREQPIRTLLVPRQAIAAAAVVVVAVAPLWDKVDAEAVLLRLLIVFDRPRQIVPRHTGFANNFLDVERAAQERDRRIDLRHARWRIRRTARLAGRVLVFELIREHKREPAVPEDQHAAAEEFVRDQAVATVALVVPVGTVHAVVAARTLVVLDEIRHDRFVCGLRGDLDPLDEQTDDPPREALQLRPHTGDNTEYGPQPGENPGVRTE